MPELAAAATAAGAGRAVPPRPTTQPLDSSSRPVPIPQQPPNSRRAPPSLAKAARSRQAEQRDSVKNDEKKAAIIAHLSKAKSSAVGGLLVSHTASLRKTANAARERVVSTKSFWDMQRLVADCPVDEKGRDIARPILQILEDEVDEYRGRRDEMGGWESARERDGSMRGRSYKQIFGNSRAGINFVDRQFGWNLAMHAAVQGRYVLLLQLMEYNPRQDYKGDYYIDCETSFKLDLTVRSTQTRTVAYTHSRGTDMTEQLEEAYGVVEDKRGSTLYQLLDRRLSLGHHAELTGGRKVALSNIRPKWRRARKIAIDAHDEGLRDLMLADELGKRSDARLFDEAEMRFVLGMQERNVFSRFAAALVLFYIRDKRNAAETEAELKQRTIELHEPDRALYPSHECLECRMRGTQCRYHDNGRGDKALDVFNAWRMVDPSVRV